MARSHRLEPSRRDGTGHLQAATRIAREGLHAVVYLITEAHVIVTGDAGRLRKPRCRQSARAACKACSITCEGLHAAVYLITEAHVIVTGDMGRLRKPRCRQSARAACKACSTTCVRQSDWSRKYTPSCFQSLAERLPSSISAGVVTDRT